jgi:hypothetical protein
VAVRYVLLYLTDWLMWRCHPNCRLLFTFFWRDRLLRKRYRLACLRWGGAFCRNRARRCYWWRGWWRFGGLLGLASLICRENLQNGSSTDQICRYYPELPFVSSFGQLSSFLLESTWGVHPWPRFWTTLFREAFPPQKKHYRIWLRWCHSVLMLPFVWTNYYGFAGSLNLLRGCRHFVGKLLGSGAIRYTIPTLSYQLLCILRRVFPTIEPVTRVNPSSWPR